MLAMTAIGSGHTYVRIKTQAHTLFAKSALAKTGTTRENNTSVVQSSERVSDYAVMIGDQLPVDYVHHLYYASTLSS